MVKEIIKQQLSFLSSELIEELAESSILKEIPKGTQILREGQYVKSLPIVLSGLVKVLSSFEERELLLYYIQPKQSCVMSFAAALSNQPGKVVAITDEDSEILLIPAEKLPSLLKKFPDLNELIYAQYDLRYTELLDTIQHVLFNKMDQRLFDYLKQKIELTHQEAIKLSHSQIASDLGTAREVVSRIMKKLELGGKVSQEKDGIRILE